MPRRTCYFSGNVQGVGFRYTAHNLALRYDVKGYVKNLPDGRVELVMEGPSDDMDGLLDDLKSKLDSFVGKVVVQESPGTGEFTQFNIRH